MTSQSGVSKRSGIRFGFAGEIISELKKVVWLTRREATYLTGLVLLVSIVTGIILGALDYSFTRLIDSVFLGG